ncbi:protein CTLA-2-alpha-like [Rhinophrynus dorsalis]
MLRFCLLVLVFPLVQSALSPNTELDSEWELWKTKFNKQYKSEKEEGIRRLNWERNLQIIAKHNEEYAQGRQTYTMGMNQFGDLGPNEDPCGHHKAHQRPHRRRKGKKEPKIPKDGQ